MSVYSVALIVFFVSVGFYLLGVLTVVMAIVAAISAFLCAICIVTSNPTRLA